MLLLPSRGFSSRNTPYTDTTFPGATQNTWLDKLGIWNAAKSERGHNVRCQLPTTYSKVRSNSIRSGSSRRSPTFSELLAEKRWVVYAVTSVRDCCELPGSDVADRALSCALRLFVDHEHHIAAAAGTTQHL